ncbi:MAG: helix-turn-helix domain-containing protein, partial [Puniceicoccales bacterium]|nr:helix-turn-helix domain-containing protein [Puniceicoccales bacterium]
LLEARQRQGISIREAAENTKIRGDILEFMETNQFDHIPLAEVYKRGFLKIYARFLHIDSERLVAEYTTINPMAPTRIAGTGRRAGRDSNGRGETSSLVEKGNFNGAAEELPPMDFPPSAVESGTPIGQGKNNRLSITIVIAVTVLLVVGAILFRTAGKTKSPDSAPAAATSSVNYPTYKARIFVYKTTKVKVQQVVDGKIILEETLSPDARNRGREIVGRGPIDVSSPDASEVKVQFGNREPVGTGDRTATVFRVSKAPEITGGVLPAP